LKFSGLQNSGKERYPISELVAEIYFYYLKKAFNFEQKNIFEIIQKQQSFLVEHLKVCAYAFYIFDQFSSLF